MVPKTASRLPVNNSFSRSDDSNNTLKTKVLNFGAPLKYSSLAVSTSTFPETQWSNLKGPVPTGLISKPTLGFVPVPIFSAAVWLTIDAAG